MTKREAAVVEMYTGICMLSGNDIKLRYEYASKLLKRPAREEDFSNIKTIKRLKNLSKPDFFYICKFLN